MKRLTALLLVLVIGLSLLSCADHTPPKSPVTFYYPVDWLFQESAWENLNYDSTKSVILSELREGAGHEQDYLYLLDLYFQGPLDPALRSPFPKGLQALSCKISSNTAVIQLGQSFSSLSGIELTLACASIAKTVRDMTGCSRVQLSAKGAFLDGAPYIFIDCDHLLEQDIPALPIETVSEAPTTE